VFREEHSGDEEWSQLSPNEDVPIVAPWPELMGVSGFDVGPGEPPLPG
jgi:hypothetical protein